MNTSPSETRFAAFRQIARDLAVDAVALVPGANFNRAMGIGFHTSERPVVVVVPAQGSPLAIVPELELDSFALARFDGEILPWRDQDGYRPAFAALAGKCRLQSLAVEGQAMRVFVHHAFAAANPGLRVIDAEDQISATRLCKDQAEITALERAIAISQEALALTLDTTRIGMTEKQVENILVTNLMGAGAEEMSFAPIVAAGANAARPHAHARHDYAIRPGDALLLDFGAKWGGMCADITHTVFAGHVSDRHRAMFETVLAANLAGQAACLPGAAAGSVDDAAASVLEASPFARHILTRTGHGLGREVHEAPYIMRGNQQVLQAGMVFTVEPGLYAAGEVGIRIEDNLLITASGHRCLTSIDRNLRIVG